MTVFIVPNFQKERAVEVTRQATEILQEQEITVMLDETHRDECDLPDVVYADRAECARQANVVLTIGGDGTILHEAAFAASHQKPILGINLGRKGFLAICEPDEMEERLTRLAQGRYGVDRRCMLRAAVQGRSLPDHYALNDVVIGTGFGQSTLEMHIFCDGTPVEQYRGDGVIVATPTGSTAYSLAAGGPILDSRTQAMVVTPICPHSLHSPPMVFAPNRRLVIQVGGIPEGGAAYLSCDGRGSVVLQEGDQVKLFLSDKTISLVTFGDADQFQAIDQKLRSRS